METCLDRLDADRQSACVTALVSFGAQRGPGMQLGLCALGTAPRHSLTTPRDRDSGLSKPPEVAAGFALH